MKKVAIGMMVGLMSVVLMAADTNKVDLAQAAYSAAQAVSDSGDYVGAQKLFEKILADYPNADPQILAKAQFGIATGLYRYLGKPAEAQVALEKILTNYPTIPGYLLAVTQQYIGLALLSQNKQAESLAAFEKLIRNYPALSAFMRVQNTIRIGDIQKSLGDGAGSQKTYMDCVQNYVHQLGATNEESLVWQAYDKIDPILLARTNYVAFLENTIKATKATQENAAFLGRLKSELEKMK